MNISENVALSRLQPILSQLVDCTNAAVANARNVRLVGHHPATIANMISSMFEDEARTRLGATRGVNFVSRGRRFLVAFGGVMVRFKKVDDEYQTSNYPTPTSLNFDRQLPIPGMPGAPRVTLGYRLTRVGTTIANLALVFSVGRCVVWVHQITGASVTQLPLVAAALSAPARKRVKIKQTKSNAKES